MTATRVPTFGIAIAVVLLLAESVGLVVYKYQQQAAEQRAVDMRALQAAEEAILDANEARAKLEQLIMELDRLDAEIRRLPMPQHVDPKERRRLLRELKQLRIEQRELNDMLIVRPQPLAQR